MFRRLAAGTAGDHEDPFMRGGVSDRVRMGHLADDAREKR